MTQLNTMIKTVTRKTRLSTRINAVRWFAASTLIASLILILSAAESIETIGILASLGGMALGLLGFGISLTLWDEMSAKERAAIAVYRQRAYNRRMKNIIIGDTPPHYDGLVIGWDYDNHEA